MASTPTSRRTPPANAASPSPANTDTKVRSPTPTAAAAANGVTRTRALNKGSISGPASARAAAKKPGSVSGIAKESDKSEDESRAETAAIIEDLKAQLKKAETTSEEHEKQILILQSRLEEAVSEQSKMEESTNAHAERIDVLESEKKQSVKQKKELENQAQSDREAIAREREEAAIREEELNGIIKRLKESISSRDQRPSVETTSPISRNTSFRGRSSPNRESSNVIESPLARRDSSQGSKLVLQKDKVIEELRLELAEAQIRLVEMENAGGGRVRELEKTLLETRMVNAKLMEDNESYQYLLSERTLNGDLARGGVFNTNEGKPAAAPRTASHEPKNSLAEELETAEDKAEIPIENKDKPDAELTALRDQNKALTLYINKIITKILDNEKFEELFENGTITGDVNPTVGAAKLHTQKELPKPPMEEMDKENAPPSLLQRAGSLFGGRNRPRPRSSIAPASNDGQLAPTSNPFTGDGPKPLPNPMENPQTAPSVPIKLGDSYKGHSHRRSKSEWSANIQNTMYRVPSGNSPSYQPSSPTGLGSPRLTSSSGGTPQPLILEDATELGPSSTKDSMTSGETTIHQPTSSVSESGGSRPTSDDLSTSPRSVAQSISTDGRSSANVSVATGGTVFSSSSGGMRPLRLVQEKDKADEAAAAAEREKKKANRTSFMGWFQRPVSGQMAPPPPPGSFAGGRVSTDLPRDVS